MSKNQAILAAESERAHYVAQSALCALAGVSVALLTMFRVMTVKAGKRAGGRPERKVLAA